MKPQLLIILFALILFLSCRSDSSTVIFNREIVEQEVRSMFDNYHDAIAKGGLTAEFDYLDNSDDFFWVPPGYNKKLDYPTIRQILSDNAPTLSQALFKWKKLDVYPQSKHLATFVGIVNGHLVDSSGNSNQITLIESGCVIKRRSGWKLLSGQTHAISNSPD